MVKSKQFFAPKKKKKKRSKKECPYYWVVGIVDSVCRVKKKNAHKFLWKSANMKKRKNKGKEEEHHESDRESAEEVLIISKIVFVLQT